MEEPVISDEHQLGIPKEAAEHLVSSVGFSKALNTGIGRLPEDLGGLNKMIAKSKKQINAHLDHIFNGGKLEQKEEHPTEMEPQHEAVFENFANPETFNDHLAEQLKGISGVAPNITTNISHTISSGISHLNNKRPDTSRPMPLDMDREPPQSEASEFNKHLHIIENPLAILRHVKDATLLPAHVEALNTVYPHIAENIKSGVLEKMNAHIADHDQTQIPYKTRLSLGMVLGQSLDSSMTQQSIAGNQMALQGAQMAKNMQAQGQKAKPSKTGMNKLSADGDRTEAQDALERKK